MLLFLVKLFLMNYWLNHLLHCWIDTWQTKKNSKQSDISEFRAQLDVLGLKIIEVTADGNCFFRFVLKYKKFIQSIQMIYWLETYIFNFYQLKHHNSHQILITEPWQISWREMKTSMRTIGKWLFTISWYH